MTSVEAPPTPVKGLITEVDEIKPAPPTNKSTLVSAKIFECFSPPPLNSIRGAILPRMLSKRRRRRKISIEVHKVAIGPLADAEHSLEECIVRVLDPASKEVQKAAKQRGFLRSRADDVVHAFSPAVEVVHNEKQNDNAEEDGSDDESIVSTVVATEFLESGPSSGNVHYHYDYADYDKGWVAKYRFPIRAIEIKGTQKTGVTLQITVGGDRQIRELIFDNMTDAEEFETTIRKELVRDSDRARAKMVATLGKVPPEADDSISFLVEIVSAWDILAGDFGSSDPYVVCSIGGRFVHKTKYIPKTLDPIWTIKEGSLFIMTITTKDLFLNDGLVCCIHDFDKLGADENLGAIRITAKQMYEAQGERMEFKIEPMDGDTEEVPGYMAVRCRRAAPEDIEFMEEYNKQERQMSLLANLQHTKPQIAAGVAGGGALKTLMTKRERIAKDGVNAGKKQYKVRPGPDPSCPDLTSWMTKKEIDTETMKESQNWVDAGSGNLGRIFVEILGCDNLPNMDAGGFAGNKTDTFVSLVYEDAAVRTDVIDDCLAPRWLPWTQRAFIFHIMHSSSQLFIGVFDFDASFNPADDHDVIGRISVDLQNLRKNTVYILKYDIYTSARLSKRKAHGSVTIRLRMEIPDERKLLLSNMEPPPQIYVNTKTRRDFRVVRMTCAGKHDLEQYSMKTINSYIEELLSLEHIRFYVADAVISILLWRANSFIPLGGGKRLYLPLHSMTAFAAFVLLVEYPALCPSFWFAGWVWIMLATNDYRNNLPDVWRRSKTFREFVEVLVLGASTTPPHSISAYCNYEDSQAFLEQWAKRIADAEEAKAKAYEQSMKEQEEYLKEMEEIGEVTIDISTKRGGMSVDPFKPILFPLQQNLAMVCRYLRHVKFIVTWEECYISFWVTTGFFLLSFVCFFIPWFFIIKWTSRIIVWTIFGPWMKLVDIFYVGKMQPMRPEQLREQIKKDREKRLKVFAAAVSAARISRENMLKLKAIKQHMFGKYIMRVPVLKEDRFEDVPLPESSAEPYMPAPRPLSELAMEEAGYRKTRLSGQQLIGDMIPRVQRGFTEAPVGQATAYPGLLDKEGAGAAVPDSTTAAYVKLGSLVAAAGVVTWFGVPLLGAATEYALKTA